MAASGISCPLLWGLMEGVFPGKPKKGVSSARLHRNSRGGLSAPWVSELQGPERFTKDRRSCYTLGEK